MSFSRIPAGPSATSTPQPAAEPLTAASYGTVLWSTSTRVHGLDAHATHAAMSAKTEQAFVTTCTAKLKQITQRRRRIDRSRQGRRIDRNDG